MKICSEFKDYYDIGMSKGQDLTLVYQRHKKIVNGYPFPVFNSFDKVVYHDFMVGFCGKLYPILELKSNSFYHEDIVSSLCYNIADIDNFIHKYYPEDFEWYNTVKYTKCRGNRVPKRHKLVEFFENCNKFDCKDLFEKERSPIFVGRYKYRNDFDSKVESTITYNDFLRPFEFYRVFDPYTAFQEIAMWLGNEAEPRKVVPVPSDSIMLEIKGFDKFSFRKDKKVKK